MIEDDVLAVHGLRHVTNPADDILQRVRPEAVVEEDAVSAQCLIECQTQFLRRLLSVGQMQRLVRSHRHEAKG